MRNTIDKYRTRLIELENGTPELYDGEMINIKLILQRHDSGIDLGE